MTLDEMLCRLIFQTGSSNNPQLLPHFLNYHIPLGGIFFRNIIIILCINYKTILMFVVCFPGVTTLRGCIFTAQ
jgi:hypothetical protein